MKKSLFVVLFALISCVSFAQTKIIDAKSSSTKSSIVVNTEYSYKISGIEYPILIGGKGSLYINRISSKGNTYKMYLTSKLSLAESEAIYQDYINTLPDNIYESISLTLGDNTSSKDMVIKYLSHKDKYDSLPYDTIDSTF